VRGALPGLFRLLTGVLTCAFLAACAAPEGNGIDVVDEMIDVGLWSATGLHVGDFLGCEECGLAVTIEYAREPSGLVTQTTHSWVHDPASSDWRAGDLFCADIHEHAPITFRERNPDPDLRWIREQLGIDESCPDLTGWLSRGIVASEIVQRDANGDPTIASWWPPFEPDQPFPGFAGQFRWGVEIQGVPWEPCPPDAMVEGTEYCTRDCRFARSGESACSLPAYDGPQ
jgi:hypothetical protein